jgi:hypothetical protein
MMLACRSFVLDALCKKMMERTNQPVDVWTAGERMAVAVAANTWAESHGMARRVTVADVERVEQMAVGHIDYGPKLALYVAELLYQEAA